MKKNITTPHPNGFIRGDRFIVDNIYPALSTSTQKTYGYFLDNYHCFEDPTCTRRLKTISSKTIQSERTVRRGIVILEEKGLLETKKKEGSATTYILKFPWRENPDFLKEIKSGSWRSYPLPADDIPANFGPTRHFASNNITQLPKNNDHDSLGQNQPCSNQNNIPGNTSNNNPSKESSSNEDKLIELIKQQMEMIKQQIEENSRVNDRFEKLAAQQDNLIRTIIGIISQTPNSNTATNNLPIFNISNIHQSIQNKEELVKDDISNIMHSDNDATSDPLSALVNKPSDSLIINQMPVENIQTQAISTSITAVNLPITAANLPITAVKMANHIIEDLNIDLNKTTTTNLASYPLEAKKEDSAQISDWSSSSDFKNLNEIQENIDLIDIEIASRFGITQSKIRQLLLKGNHTAQEIQDSIDAYCFDLIENNKLKNIKNPCAYFMKTMLDGNSFHFPKNYISREDAEKLKLQKIEAKKEQNEIELKRELEELVRKKIDYLLKENLEELQELETIAKEKSKQTASINIQHEAYNHLDEKGRKEMVDFMVDIGINLELEEVVQQKFFSNHPAMKKCELLKK